MGCRLEIRRPERGYTDRLRAYRVLVDNADVARLRRGETITVPLAPGPHELRLAIDWGGSRTLKIDAAPDGTVKLVCHSTYPAWLAFAGFLRPNNWITVETDG